jgi:hypothetical protein
MFMQFRNADMILAIKEKPFSQQTADSRKAQAHEDGRKDAKLPLDLDHPQRTPVIPGVVVTFEYIA